MKFGLLLNSNTRNLGDDIQTYAIERFLPQVDYYINRERIDEFIPRNKEKVATVMSAWWMWEKWNWPPSKYILPKFTSFHYSDNYKAKQAGCPMDYDYLTGIGGEYLKAYGPIGVRDEFTKKKLETMGIESYFSGCITLTLQKQNKVDDGEYICLVDINSKVAEKIKNIVKPKGIEVKEMTHILPKGQNNIKWDLRRDRVEEFLSVYQNAKCVITSRLQCALPCLSMGVKTLICVDALDSIRYFPYYEWVYSCTNIDFLRDIYKYDVLNPPENKTEFQKYREEIIKDINYFVKSCIDGSFELDNKFDYLDSDIEKWRIDMMIKTIDKWIVILNADRMQIQNLERKTFVKKIKDLFTKVDDETMSFDELISGSTYLPSRQIMLSRVNINRGKQPTEESLSSYRLLLRLMLSISRSDFIKLGKLMNRVPDDFEGLDYENDIN